MESPSPESSPPPPSTPSAAEKTILRWDSTASDHSSSREKMIFTSSDRFEVERYLSAVDELQKTLSKTSLSATSSPESSSSTLQIAMARLEDEFRSILISHTSPMESDSLLLKAPQDEDEAEENEEKEDEVQEFDGDKQIEHLDSTTSSVSISSSRYESTSSIREMDLIPGEAVSDLRLIAQRMISANYVRECVQVYASVRKSAVDATLQGLNVAKLSIGDIQRLEWDALEAQIRRWIRAAKVCVRVVFASERRLCEQVFQGLDSSPAPSSSLDGDGDGDGSVNYTNGLGTVGDMCFVETLKGPAIQLFNFAEAISISRRSPEKLFKILDLHDAFTDLLPDIEAVFESKSCESIRVQAVEILSRLAEAARGILSEFESAVLREPSRVPVPGGTIHPLTRYVMNYISLISDYKQTLAELIVSKPAMGLRYSSDPNVPDVDLSEFENHQSSVLALHLIWIIVTLQFNLEGKSKHYKDASLAHLFMMNNVHYIVHKVKDSPELREMIGDNYLRKLTGKFRLSATNYQRATWVRVLYCLRDEGLHVSGSFSSGVSKTALRERFKSFNAMFEEVHRTQATWIVPDSQLREELRISISEKVIPAYRSFLGRFRSHIECGKHPENYIKYSVEDLENAVLDFFEGYPVSQHLRRRPQ